MDYSGYKNIQFERNGKILRVTLNRPQALNAVNAELHAELSTLFYDIAQDNLTDVAVLTGAGRAFCAGGDIEWMQSEIDNPHRFHLTMAQAKRIISGILDCDKPIVCRMNGDAVGLGATIALFSDIIIAAETARIGDPHVKVGFVAGDGGAVIWPQLIGYARAKQFLLTGDLIAAPEAARIGLINESVPPEELDPRVDAMANKLASGALLAISWTKTVVNIGLKQLANSMMDASMAYEALSNRTADHQEAVNAFRERRKSKFTGK